MKLRDVLQLISNSTYVQLLFYPSYRHIVVSPDIVKDDAFNKYLEHDVLEFGSMLHDVCDEFNDLHTYSCLSITIDELSEEVER